MLLILLHVHVYILLDSIIEWLKLIDLEVFILISYLEVYYLS